MKITRENIRETYEALIQEKENLSNKVYEFNYRDVSLIGSKPINLMSKIEIVIFQPHLKSFIADQEIMSDFIKDNPQFFTDKDYSMKFNFEINLLESDIYSRLHQLVNEERLEKIKDALKVIKKNLSDDDKFSIDMQALDI